MFGRRRQDPPPGAEEHPPRLKDAIREARIESAERAGVVVDLRDAELARLELLDEALDPLFADIPADVDLFDRGISHGDTPRLWIDVLAHISMGRDKRLYRFVQDSRFGRKVLAESFEPAEIVDAVMHYVARRMVEREQALAEDSTALTLQGERDAQTLRRRRRWRAVRMFLLGLIIGSVALFAAAWLLGPPPP
jgi:hypothetical protein